jgi:sigma-B regulation protein RsbU (phosphoserine phosphatase)
MDLQADGQRRWALTTKVPLHDLRGKLIGLVGISHDITERKRVEEELRDRSIEMETDLRMACQIQNVFLTQTYPVFPRGVPAEASALRFAHRYLPAASLGGDFFEVVQLSDTQCVVLICDVMGHGVRAGLLTALIRGLVGELDERTENPAQVLAEINRGFMPIFQQTGQPVFATVFCGVIDTELQRLTYANAGHPSPLHLRRATGTVVPLCNSDPEPAAGLVDGYLYTRHECPFAVGDLLLGYTDGVLEAADSNGELFGEERLMALTIRHGESSGQVLIDKVVSAVRGFSGREQFDDDICLLAVESTGMTCPVYAPNWEI